MKETQAEKLETSVENNQPEDIEIEVADESTSGENIEAGSPPESETPETKNLQTTENQPPEWANIESRENQPQIEGVPYDTQGKRPSEKIRYSIDFDGLLERAQRGEPLTTAEVEQIYGRFRGMYRENRALDRHLNQLADDNLIFQQGEQDRQKEHTKTEITQALESMDYNKAAELLTQQTQPQTDAPQREIDPQSMQAIDAYQSQLDDHGNYVRPWMQPNHPLQNFALTQATALLNHPELAHADTAEVLGHLDRVMQNITGTNQPQQLSPQSPQTQTRSAPQTLTSDPNIRTIKSVDKLTLSPEQKRVAERIFSKMTPKEAYQRYARGVKAVAITMPKAPE